MESTLGGMKIKMEENERERSKMNEMVSKINETDIRIHVLEDFVHYKFANVSFNFPENKSGVNFINILHYPFLNECALHSFSLITVWLCDFLANAARKMLMKLTPGMTIS